MFQFEITFRVLKWNSCIFLSGLRIRIDQRYLHEYRHNLWTIPLYLWTAIEHVTWEQLNALIIEKLRTFERHNEYSWSIFVRDRSTWAAIIVDTTFVFIFFLNGNTEQRSFTMIRILYSFHVYLHYSLLWLARAELNYRPLNNTCTLRRMFIALHTVTRDCNEPAPMDQPCHNKHEMPRINWNRSAFWIPWDERLRTRSHPDCPFLRQNGKKTFILTKESFWIIWTAN